MLNLKYLRTVGFDVSTSSMVSVAPQDDFQVLHSFMEKAEICKTSRLGLAVCLLRTLVVCFVTLISRKQKHEWLLTVRIYPSGKNNLSKPGLTVSMIATGLLLVRCSKLGTKTYQPKTTQKMERPLSDTLQRDAAMGSITEWKSGNLPR